MKAIFKKAKPLFVDLGEESNIALMKKRREGTETHYYDLSDIPAHSKVQLFLCLPIQQLTNHHTLAEWQSHFERLKQQLQKKRLKVVSQALWITQTNRIVGFQSLLNSYSTKLPLQTDTSQLQHWLDKWQESARFALNTALSPNTRQQLFALRSQLQTLYSQLTQTLSQFQTLGFNPRHIFLEANATTTDNLDLQIPQKTLPGLPALKNADETYPIATLPKAPTRSGKWIAIVTLGLMGLWGAWQFNIHQPQRLLSWLTEYTAHPHQHIHNAQEAFYQLQPLIAAQALNPKLNNSEQQQWHHLLEQAIRADWQPLLTARLEQDLKNPNLTTHEAYPLLQAYFAPNISALKHLQAAEIFSKSFPNLTSAQAQALSTLWPRFSTPINLDKHLIALWRENFMKLPASARSDLLLSTYPRAFTHSDYLSKFPAWLSTQSTWWLGPDGLLNDNPTLTEDLKKSYVAKIVQLRRQALGTGIAEWIQQAHPDTQFLSQLNLNSRPSSDKIWNAGMQEIYALNDTLQQHWLWLLNAKPLVPHDPEHAFQTLKTLLENPKSILALLNTKVPNELLPLQQWVNNYLQSLRILTAQTLSKHWEENIHPTWHTLSTQYPFSHQATQEADQKQALDFLNPSGPFAQYLETYLHPFLEMNTTPWKVKTLNGLPTLALNTHELLQLERLSLLSQALFQPSATHVFAWLRIDHNPNVNDVEWHYNGLPLMASHGILTFTWPTPQHSAFLTIQPHGHTTMTPLASRGPWALWHLLDRGHLESSVDPTHFVWQFLTEGGPIRYEIQTDRALNLLQPGLWNLENLKSERFLFKN